MNKAISKVILVHFVAVGIFFLLNALFFAPQFSGKVPRQTDIQSYTSSSREAEAYRQKEGEQLLWTNAMFGGMPTYQISMSPPRNHLKLVFSVLQLGFQYPFGVFFAMMLGFYIMLVVLGVHPSLAIVGGIAYGFTTNSLILFEAGHNTKLGVLSLIPLVVAGMYLLYERKKLLWGLVLLGIAAGASLIGNHIQMTYYFLLTAALYAIIRLVQAIKEKSLGMWLGASGIAVIASVCAIGSAASLFWPTYEYSRDTMRGAPILSSTEKVDASSSSTVDGLSWDYAMQWSNGLADVAATIIPRFAGGASGEKVKEGATYTALRSSGMQLNPDGSMDLPLYWGSLPFTSGPSYFGAVVCFLFIFGLFLVRDSIKWWAGLAVLLTVLLSFGRNQEWLQRVFFEFVPLYNKFRAPSSILSVTAFFLPLLGTWAVADLIRRGNEGTGVKRALKWAFGVSGGLVLFFALLGGTLFDFTGAGDASYPKELQALLQQDRKAFLGKDAWRSFLFITAAAGLIWAYVSRFIRPLALAAGLGLLITVDLWTVGRRYVGADTFFPKSNVEAQFQPRPVDQEILNAEKSRGDYRVLDLSINTFNSSQTSYFHNTIGGYHASKMQRYQDLIDFHISKNNFKVLDMLNGKYIITQEQQLQQNPNALGPVWLVDSVIMVKTPNEEIEALNGFEPARHAVVLDQEFGGYIGNFDPQQGGTIRLAEYDPQHLVYDADVPSEQLAVFSEIWYGPDKGWKAKIDGKEVAHIRANYALRALRVPAGKHKIEFVFEPKSVVLGGKISGMASLLLLFGLIIIALQTVYTWFRNPVLPAYLTPMQTDNPPVAAKEKILSGKVANVNHKKSVTEKKKGGNKR